MIGEPARRESETPGANELANISRAKDQPGVEKTDMQGGKDDGERHSDADRIEGIKERSDGQDRRKAQCRREKGNLSRRAMISPSCSFSIDEENTRELLSAATP
jgi:hypothetical protein